MFDKFTDGNCPQCLLAGKTVEMRLNYHDLWACPECGLQAHTASWGMFAIMRERSRSGLTTTKAAGRVGGYVLTKADAKEWFKADSAGFDSEAELREFLDKEVTRPA